jgi:F-type H+-transporting ATPase subunit a
MQSLRLKIACAFFVCALLALNAAMGETAPAATGSAGLAASGPAPAAHAETGLPQSAQSIGRPGGFVTNSMLVTWVVAAGVILFARFATRKMQEVPGGAQNFWEWLVEGLYGFLEGIIGPGLVKKTFWFFATIFVFILATNWFGLLPGVGTIGWGLPGEHGFEVTRPLLRGGNADLNMTSAMALTFMVCWAVWALRFSGVKGTLLHIFGPKGDSAGVIKYLMIGVFFAVGFLELISIAFRPVSLSFRLYGNIFAGENLLEAMANMVAHPAWARVVFGALLPVPFYFMELLVGFIQAAVFMLLTSVFTALICTHEEETGEASH